MERMARSVLVVDDSAPFRATARALLEARGYRVVGAVAGGGEALAAVEAMRPDAVLLDINLPDADGVARRRAAGRRGRPGGRARLHARRGRHARRRSSAPARAASSPRPSSPRRGWSSCWGRREPDG